MIVGTEWLIEAFDCEAEKLRDAEVLREMLGAKKIQVTKIERGNGKAKSQNLKSKIVGGQS